MGNNKGVIGGIGSGRSGLIRILGAYSGEGKSLLGEADDTKVRELAERDFPKRFSQLAKTEEELKRHMRRNHK